MAMERESGSISPHTALVYLMVLVSAVDREMTDAELRRIGEIVRNMPVFEGYNQESLVPTAQDCAEILKEDDGFETVVSLVYGALPENLLDTAYAIACDIAAADGKISQEELRVLEIVRHEFDLDRLTAAAIERGVSARYRRL